MKNIYPETQAEKAKPLMQVNWYYLFLMFLVPAVIFLSMLCFLPFWSAVKLMLLVTGALAVLVVVYLSLVSFSVIKITEEEPYQ